MDYCKGGVRIDLDYVDQDLGWRITVQTRLGIVDYCYTNLSSGDTMQGRAIPSAFKDPAIAIREHLMETHRLAILHSAGVLWNQISRRILEMVAELHAREYESVYIDPEMAPSGMFWRYEISFCANGKWPNRDFRFDYDNRLCVKGSIGGGFDQEIPWGKATDSVTSLADGFCAAYPDLLTRATEPNAPYIEWYQEMLRATAPEGVLIFSCDDRPDHEYAFTWNGPHEFRMRMPPGFSAGHAV